MSGYPAAAYIVCAAAAALASSAELGTRYRRSPFTNKQFGWRWFGVAALDGSAGMAALAIVHALDWPKHAVWLNWVLGWAIVGLVATLIVRADLLSLPIGGLSVPIGFGVVYGTVRSLLEPGMVAAQWELDDAERDGRLLWSLGTADAKAATLQLAKVEVKLRDYVSKVIVPRNLGAGADAQRRTNEAIDSARRNTSSGELEAIKQLITFMVNEDYVPPLNRLLGRPTRRQVRSWRNGP
jgi:hypothetical protein